MKFLCVDCDEAMALRGARGPEEGSMTVIFGCPSCDREIAMLTNSMETQMVRSLGVKIGGRTVPAEPMEIVRGSLSGQRDDLLAEEAPAPPPAAPTGSKCPFTGVVTEAYAQKENGIVWSAEAEARLDRIPSFVQPMVRKGIEQHARDHGYQEITADVMNEVKGMFGM